MKTTAWVLALGGLLALHGTLAAAESDETEWKAKAKLSYVNTTGNTETQVFAGKAEVSADATPNRYFAEASGLYGKNDGDVNNSRWFVGARYERALTEQLFAFLSTDYLKDTYSGYDMRVTAGPGVGYEFIKTDDHNLKGLFSVLYVREDLHAVPEPADDTDSYASGKAKGNYAWQITENLRFIQNADFSVSFKDTDVYFANSETGLELKLSDLISLGVSYIVSYQHAPPEGADDTDTLFLTSLEVSY